MTLDMSLEHLSELISDIYDCSIDPGGWERTLTKINASLNGAYTTLYMFDQTALRHTLLAHSPWDPEQFVRLDRDFQAREVPGTVECAIGDVDTPLSTLAMMSEQDFQASRFYREWAAPQGLRDGCIVKFADTAERVGMMVMTTRDNREAISAEQRRFIALLSPHLRRAAIYSTTSALKRNCTAVRWTGWLWRCFWSMLNHGLPMPTKKLSRCCRHNATCCRKRAR
jgi:hypothetical protein